MRTFVVTAERTPRGWWALEAPEVGAVSQVRRLDQVADEMTEAVAHLAGLPEDQVQIECRPVLPEQFTHLRDLAQERRADSERLAREASAATRQAVAVLGEQGVTVRDIGTLLGISPQRVSQLSA